MINQKVDIVEAYTLMREQIPVGSLLPVFFIKEDGYSGGLIVGHIFKNIRKNPRKHHFWDVCLPIVYFGREKYVCSLHFENGKITGIASKDEPFCINEWKTDKFIVEIT